MMTACFTIFRRSPTTFRRFLKILQNLSESHTNVAEHFPKVSEDVQRLPKVVEEFRGRDDDVSIIHQRIYLVHLYSALCYGDRFSDWIGAINKPWRVDKYGNFNDGPIRKNWNKGYNNQLILTTLQLQWTEVTERLRTTDVNRPWNYNLFRGNKQSAENLL